MNTSVAHILIVDFGSQYTPLILRKLRELGFSGSLVSPHDKSPDLSQVKGIVLSGGPDSVEEESEWSSLPSWVLESSLPLLGICYGMQALVKEFGGRLSQGEHREYGLGLFHLTEKGLEHSYFSSKVNDSKVWMSHGDSIDSLGEHFDITAVSDKGLVAAVAHKSKRILGLQFHPEVYHTENGLDFLRDFATDFCGLKPQEPWSHLEFLLKEVKDSFKGERVLLGCSGGVDSSLAALFLTRALGKDKVTCVLVDHGFMRKGEVEDVTKRLKAHDLDLHILDESELYFSTLKGVSEPEKKRKIIGENFINVFEKFAGDFGPFTHLAQGTLYSDVIESAGHGGKAKVIKSHHNVGGLPEKLQLELLEPFRFLFKDEIRSFAPELGLAEDLTQRHPFPGPGLAIRIPGEVTREKVRVLQEADAIYVSALKESGLYEKIWQAGAFLLPVKSVGIMGDNRTYEDTCVLRAVGASDAMTADVYPFDVNFLSQVATQIVRQVPGINRVLYDVTTKPPATIEWE